MSRTRPRVSRALIGVLAVTLVIALAVWLSNSGAGEPAEVSAAPVESHEEAKPPVETANVEAPKSEIVATPALNEAPKKPEPARTSTPTMRGNAGAPVQFAENPTTKPAASAAQQLALATPQAAKPVQHVSSSMPTPAPVAPSMPAQIAPQPASTAIPAAKELMTNGQWLTARDTLNAALDHDGTTPAEVEQIKTMLVEVNQTVAFGPQRYSSDPHGGTYTVKSGDRMSKIAAEHDVTWELLGRINNITDPKKLRAGQSIKVLRGPFHALVDKSDFTLEIWQGAPEEKGSIFVTRFKVGLGADDSTPTGTWIVETDRKIKNPTYYSPRGEGVIEADDPSNPLGEFWIGLAGIGGNAVGKESYGIHGTIEPDSIGKQQSMGCVRLLNEDVARVYELLVEGQSTVVVRD